MAALAALAALADWPAGHRQLVNLEKEEVKKELPGKNADLFAHVEQNFCSQNCTSTLPVDNSIKNTGLCNHKLVNTDLFY